MKTLLKLEELGMLLLSIYLIYMLDLPIPWWLYLLLFFSPDIGMIGYLINTKVGAMTYNILHHKGIASVLIFMGMLQGNDFVLVAGLLMFAHASFDRILGYGLKYANDFKNTHLGLIGNKEKVIQ